MIGRIIAFTAIAVSCSTALPFGNCGPWDAQTLNNILSGPSNIIPSGINFPPAGPVIDAPAFPSNIFQNVPNLPPALSAIPPLPAPLPPLPPLPAFPAPSLPFPRIPAPAIQIPNVQVTNIPAPIIPGPQLIQNVEARIPNIHTRIPAVQARVQPFDASFPSFPIVQPQVFTGSPVGAPQFGPC